MVANIFEWLHPGGDVTWMEWVHFCDWILGTGALCVVAGVLGFFVAVWLSPSDLTPKAIRRPHRMGKVFVWIMMVIGYILYLIIGAPDGKTEDFVFNSGPIGLVIILGVVAQIVYTLVTYLITQNSFSGRYQYVTWLARIIRRSKTS